jgi:hypothetical protein
MKPEEIQLSSVNGMFEYEKLSRDIDTIGDLDTCKTMLKAYVKLYIKQKETLSSSFGIKPQ